MSQEQTNNIVKSFGGKPATERPTFNILERGFYADGIKGPEIELLESFAAPAATDGTEALKASLNQIAPFFTGRAVDGQDVTGDWIYQNLTVEEIAELLEFIGNIAGSVTKKGTNRAQRRERARKNKQGSAS